MAENSAPHYLVQIIKEEYIPEDSIIRLTASIFRQNKSDVLYGVMFEVAAVFRGSGRLFSLNREIYDFENGRCPVFEKTEAIKLALAGWEIAAKDVLDQHVGYLKDAYHKLASSAKTEGVEDDD